MIRERTVGPGIVDEISAVLRDSRYAMRHYPDGLTEAVLGPHTTDRVGVSRYYLMRDPKVVVDFEPSPLDGKMYCEEKRRFFHERGVVYVPVFLRERLTMAAFQHRVDQEHEAMRRGKAEAADDEVLDVAALIESKAMQEFVAAEALARLNAEIRAGRKLFGVAREARLANHRNEVIAELKRKAADGSLGREQRYRELAVAAG
jgi:hypothetical protein